jgi:hypothetical protein
VSIPDVAVNWTVDVPAVAVLDAARLTCCGVPGIIVGAEGDAVMPMARPLNVTSMVWLNPLRAVAVSVTGCAAPPEVRLTLARFAVKEKSGELLVGVPPPQPTTNAVDARIASHQIRICLAMDMASVLPMGFGCNRCGFRFAESLRPD